MKLQVNTGKLSTFKGNLFFFLVNTDDVISITKGKKSGLELPLTSGEWAKKLGASFKKRRFEGKDFETYAEDSSSLSSIFVGWSSLGGKVSSYDRTTAFRRLGSLICKEAAKRHSNYIGLGGTFFQNISKKDIDALIEGVLLTDYSFDSFRSEKPSTTSKATSLDTIEVFGTKALKNSDFTDAQVTSEAVMWARDLINTPPNFCKPSFLVAEAKRVAKKVGCSCEIFDKTKLAKLGAGSLLSVAKGSEEPPYLIKLVHKPKKSIAKKNGKTPIIALVGKGVTFDSGGLSIKSAGGMETMKCDMSGAAAVLAAMSVIAKMNCPLEVRAYVPTTENMINGKATRPGDVVTAMNKKTIEILNTDAEGRLILADALCLAEKDGADIIVDIATLTGAIGVALGRRIAGLFSDDDLLAAKMITAGEDAGERFWRLPLAKEYRELLKSGVADMKNIGTSYGGALTAAMFLKEFVKTTKWVHLDIAAVAFEDSDRDHIRRGGVGFGVNTLAKFVMSFA